MLTVTNSNASFILNERESIDLELKLNVSFYGRLWREKIGEFLFKYGIGSLPSNQTLTVSDEEYNFLEMLRSKGSWKDCHDLK